MGVSVNNGTRFAGGGEIPSGQVIGSTVYDPGTVSNLASASTTYAAVDAVNLAVVFVVPPSGIVDVELEGVSVVGGSTAAGWGLIDGSTVIAAEQVMYDNQQSRIRCKFRVSGLTPGITKTYKWALARTYGTGICQIGVGGGSGVITADRPGPAMMTVLAVGSYSAQGVPLPNSYGVGIDDPAIFTGIYGTAFAEDQEFDTAGVITALPTDWSWLNQTGATYEQKAGAGILIQPAVTATETRRGVMRAVPTASTWQMQAKVTSPNATPNYSDYGVFLTDGTKVITLRNPSDVLGWYVSLHPTVTGGGGSTIGSLSSKIPGSYFRIVKNSATSYDFYMSTDGLTWLPIITGYNVSAQFTPTNIGFYSMTLSSSPAFRTACHWMRFRT